MAGSLKDALRKSGLAPEPAAKPKPTPAGAGGHRDELPDDESLPPRFDAPALTRAAPSDPGVGSTRPRVRRPPDGDDQ